MGRRPYVPKFTQLTLNCTQEGQIHFTWYQTVGVWTSPIGHATAVQLAREMIHLVQDRTSHNRKSMAKPEKWQEIIKTYCELYNMMEAT